LHDALHLHCQKNSEVRTYVLTRRPTEINLHELALDHTQKPICICTLPFKVQIQSIAIKFKKPRICTLYHHQSTISRPLILYQTPVLQHPSCTSLRWAPPKPSIVKLVPHLLLQINGFSFFIMIMIMVITTFPFLHNLCSLLLWL